VCGSNDSSWLYEGILKCPNCGHVFADLSLDDEQLFKLYHKEFFFGEAYNDYVADKKIIQKNFEKRYKVLARFLDPSRHRHLFEIGSAYGFFLDLVRTRFAQVQGIDITEDGVKYARQQLKLEVAQADFLRYDLAEQKFDVVCMWDTIEHLRDPQLYIEKLSQHMESGALLAITTGDIESFNARRQKAKWRLIEPPIHVHYFSKRSLIRLLENYGFEVVYKRYCGFSRSLDLVAYTLLVLRGKKAWLYKLLKTLRLTRLDFYLNLYDIMYIIARKR
jgi:predicted TPR repeat methyltransferase